MCCFWRTLDTCAFMPEDFAALLLAVRMTSPSHCLHCTLCSSRAGQWCVFQMDEIQRQLKCMGFHIDLSKATRGERQKIEWNYLFPVCYLQRTEKHRLWKRKLKLVLVFSFFPAANVFPHKHAWLLPCWTLGSGVLEAFLGGEGWPGWQSGARLGLF